MGEFISVEDVRLNDRRFRTGDNCEYQVVHDASYVDREEHERASVGGLTLAPLVSLCLRERLSLAFRDHRLVGACRALMPPRAPL